MGGMIMERREGIEGEKEKKKRGWSDNRENVFRRRLVENSRSVYK